MFGSSSSESAERSHRCGGRGVFDGLGQHTKRYNSSLQLTATSAPLDEDMHPEDLTSSPSDGIKQATSDVEADGMGEPGKVRGGSGDFEDSLTNQILDLALPALVSLSVDPLMSAVDTMFIGRLDPELGGGPVGLGALGINTYVFYFSLFVFGFLATVPTPFVASARARGDEVGASRLIGWLLTSALILGLVVMIILEAAGPNIVRLMGATAYNEAEALSYLRARATSAPAVLLMNVGNGAFRGFLDTKTPLLISLGATALNFTLDPILIFAAGLGVEGAAIATAVAEWSGALAFLYLLSRKEPSITPRRPSLPDSAEGWAEVRKVVASSAAIFSKNVTVQVIYIVVTASAARIGGISIAAHQVASQFWVILAFMGEAVAVAAQGLVAERMGAGSIPKARQVARRVLTMGVSSGIAALAVVGALRRVLPLIFTPDEEVLSAVAPIMGVIAVLQPVNAYVFAGDGVLQGSQDFVYEALSMLLTSCLGIAYIFMRMEWGSGGGAYTLVDLWTGLAIVLGTRGLTFTFRHFIDPNGPLAVKASSKSGDGEYGKAPSDEDEG